MKQLSKRDALIRDLGRELAAHLGKCVDPLKSVKHVSHYTLPSLLEPCMYRGIDLRQLVPPPSDVPLDILHQFYEVFLWWRVKGGVRYAETFNNSEYSLSPHVKSFVDDKFERAMWWIGSRDDMSLNLQGNSLIVEGCGLVLGVDNGKVLSSNPLIAGANLDIDRAALGPSRKVTRDPTFVSIRARAAYVKENAEAAVSVLRYATTPAPFNTVAPWKIANLIGPEQVAKAKEILTQEDPFGRLYEYLVPRYLNRAQFSRCFGKLERRKLNPTPSALTKAYRSLNLLSRT